jgi:hypothetical protein
MAEFVKLPSGKFLNLNTIIDTEKQIYVGNDMDSLFTVYVNGHDEEGSDIRHIEGADARALYAYLSAQAVVIGEDGKEVKPNAEPGINLTSKRIEVLAFLGGRTARISASNIIGETGASLVDVSALREAGMIQRFDGTGVLEGLDCYEITDQGRRTLGKAKAE